MSNILVVDDSQSNARLLKVALESEGYHVVCVYTGQDAVNTTRELLPSVIVTDLRLPGSSIDGWSVIRTIKEDPTVAHIPIVVTAVEVSPEDRERAFAAGCDVYFPKPFRVQELRSQIAAFTDSTA
jgi:CheY-like chemotaxis protein